MGFVAMDKDTDGVALGKIQFFKYPGKVVLEATLLIGNFNMFLPM